MRRAGSYLAQLGWLAGYPDDGGWRRIEDDAVAPLDGAAIAKARRTARTVIREHREALPRLVGDVDAWWAIVDAKLSWASDHLAGRAGVTDLLPRLVPHLPPRTVTFLGRVPGAATHAIAIAYAGDDALSPLVTWLDERPLAFAEPRLIIALARLVVLGDQGKARAVRERGVDALIRLCELDAPDSAAALQANRNVENRLREQPSSKRPAPDPTRSPARVVPWVIALATRASTHRQRVLALLAEAQLAEALAPWQAWEREHEALLERAKQLAEVTFDDRAEKAKHEAKLIAKIEKSRSKAPIEVSLAGALRELDLLGGDALARFHPSIVRVLAALPATGNVAMRARMVLHLARAAATAGDGEHLEWVWDALADALGTGAPIGLLAPWQKILTSTEHRLYLESDVVEYAKRRGDAQRLIRVLVALATSGTIGAEDPRRTARWVAAGLTDEVVVAEVVAKLRDVEGYFQVAIARAALALAGRTAGELIAVGTLLLEVVEDWRHDKTVALCALLEHAAASGGGWLVRAALDDKQAEALAAIGETLALMPRKRWPAMCHAPASTAWIARFPDALHPALRRLASVDPAAEASAAKRLADDVPDPAALGREIAALRERLDKPGAAKRLASLEDRLANPKSPSAGRLATLAAKLERAAREIGLQRFTHAITHGASERVIRAFGLPALPGWASPPKTIATLFALLALEPADRELAGRLIRARCGAPPWDLRDEPANRAYLEAMRAAGVDPVPWLDDRAMVFGEDDPITVAMTSDPIEVFAMGGHFSTCLSPGACNFFSVVANAADVNKRVIYAKRGDRVIGRCLIALTDGFSILAFHVYAHEAISELETHIRTFVLDLATRMRTTVAPRGTVRRLLSRDWYDDGPRDLVGRFRGLDEAKLDFDTIEPAAFVAILRAALDREIDDVTLPVILDHGGMQRCPHLIVPLVPYVLASAVPSIRIAAAELAMLAEDRALADRLLGDHAAAIRLEEHSWRHGQLLAELRPSYALARLRATRPRHVRSWSDERSDRIVFAGIALEALRRPKQAAEMYRLAISIDDWVKVHVEVRLAQLAEAAS